MALIPRDIENMQFRKSALGRRGYDESHVHEFLERVALELTRLNAANNRLSQQVDFRGEKALLADNDYLAGRVEDLERQLSLYKSGPVDNTTVHTLRQEIASLQRENDQLREESHNDRLGVSIRAVNMISEAQISAETTVAEAEMYARELVAAAREQYADILRRAQESTARAADGIASFTTQSANSTDPEPAEIEYIRTYATIAQKQMHAIVEALFVEIDKLGEGASAASGSPQQGPTPGSTAAPPAGPTGLPFGQPEQLMSSPRHILNRDI